MRITSYSVGGHILIELTPATPGDIIPLLTFGVSPAATLAKADPNYRGMVGMLSHLRANATIVSTDTVDLPNFELLDNDTERLVKALAVQWESPRKQLGIYQSIDGGVNWVKIAAQTLINSNGYPYTSHDLLAFLTGDSVREYPDGSSIGVKLEDVGTGLLGVGDRLVIDGSYTEVFTSTEPVSSVGQITVPNLTTVEGAIQTLNNAIANQGAELDAILASIGAIDAPGDISAQLTEIMERLEGTQMQRSESTIEATVNVGTTNTQIVAANSPLSENRRLSVVIVHAGESGAVYIRCGVEAATSMLWTERLNPGDLIELTTGEAVQAIASTGTIPVNITEVF